MRVQKRILKEKREENRFRFQWVRSAFKMEKLPSVERRNIFDQFENTSLNNDNQGKTTEIPEQMVQENMPTLSAEEPRPTYLGIDIN